MPYVLIGGVAVYLIHHLFHCLNRLADKATDAASDARREFARKMGSTRDLSHYDISDGFALGGGRRPNWSSPNKAVAGVARLSSNGGLSGRLGGAFVSPGSESRQGLMTAVDSSDEE